MTTTRMHSGSLITGLLLIVLGALFFLEQLVRVPVWHYGWPLIVIVIGVLFFIGMVTNGRDMGGLAIPGSMFVILGLILLYQNTFDHWGSWAYMWALVAPGGVGVGLYIYGWWSDRLTLRQVGIALMVIGLAIFLVLGAAFELLASMLGIITPGRFLWPVAMIVIGVALLFGRRLVHLFPAPPARIFIVDTQPGRAAQTKLSTEVKDMSSK